MRNKYKLLTILVLILVESSLIILWDKGIFKEFSLNLFTEVLGIAITILIIDFLIQKNNKQNKQEITDLAFRISLSVCNNILTIFYPERSKLEVKMTRTKFGKQEVLTLTDFEDNIGFDLNLNSKELFIERIKRNVDDPTFIDTTSTQRYIIKMNQELTNMLDLIDTALKSFQYYDDNKFYSKLLELKVCAFEYKNLISIIGGHSSIPYIISEHEIPLVNSALKLRSELKKKADNIETLLSFE